MTASVFIFGYRADQPFARLPKLHVRVGAIGYSVSDQDHTLPSDTLQVARQLKSVTLRVPLAVLGDPHRILTSARTYLGEVPLDWASWRVLELSQDP